MSTITPIAQWLNMTEAAEYLGVPHRSLQQYYRKWDIPGYKVGRSVMFRMDDLDNHLESKRVHKTTCRCGTETYNPEYCSLRCATTYQDRTSMQGERNVNWRAEDASYSAMHKRVYKERGKADHCERCGLTDSARVYNWANLTGNYGDVQDYEMMCVSCHRNYDNHRQVLSLRSVCAEDMQNLPSLPPRTWHKLYGRELPGRLTR